MYKPGDLIIIKVKVSSRTESEGGLICYSVKALSSSYSSMTVNEEDVMGYFEPKLEG